MSLQASDVHGLFRRALRAASLSLILAGASRAQCAPVAGTGCTNSLQPACTQAPRIGQQFEICLSAGATFGGPVAIGLFTCGPRTTFTGAPLCASSPSCTLVGMPLVLFSAPNRACLSGVLPNDPNLVGVSVCVQGIHTVAREPGCLVASQAVTVTLQA